MLERRAEPARAVERVAVLRAAVVRPAGRVVVVELLRAVVELARLAGLAAEARVAVAGLRADVVLAELLPLAALRAAGRLAAVERVGVARLVVVRLLVAARVLVPVDALRAVVDEREVLVVPRADEVFDPAAEVVLEAFFAAGRRPFVFISSL